MKHLRPGSGSSAKVRRRASMELNRSFILENKLLDVRIPSSSPTLKESGIPTITVTESAGQQFTETVKYDMIREENDLLSRRAQIISSDSGVRTDTSQQPIESVATTTEDDLPSSSLLQDKTATSNLDIPEVVVQDLSDRTDKGKSESGETLLTSDSKMTSESRFNPSHASAEHYLFGSQHFFDVERATTFPRETKLSRHGSAEDLRSKTLTSLGTTLSQSTDLLGDLGTCRSKRRLMHAATSESEFKLGSSDSVSNDESEILHFKPTDRFNKRLSVAMEEPEDSIPGTPKTSNPPNSPPLQSPTNRMSTFFKSLSPAHLMAFKPKKRVTFKP
ncbi:uncharacterized protein [Dysidea avara]|uniref:uncharacterized protein n=1 Tax=Dysidea avara TaxID=196820 RepID=UPI00333256BB